MFLMKVHIIWKRKTIHTFFQVNKEMEKIDIQRKT